MVMSVQSSGTSIRVERRPVAPPRRCRNKEPPTSPTSPTAQTSSAPASDSNDIPNPSSLAAWVNAHPRVNRSISVTVTPWTTSKHNDVIKTVSLERTRVKGLPPSPIVHQSNRASRTPPAPATIPRLPAKRSLQLSAQKLSDLNSERIPALPAKTIPRLPPKEKKEQSHLNSGILNPLDKKEPALIGILADNENSFSVYEDIKPSGPEFVKVTQRKDTAKCCSLPKRRPLKAIEESTTPNLSLVDHLNTVPKQTTNRPLVPPVNRSLPATRRGIPPIPKRSESTAHKPEEPNCFATSASRFFDLSTMDCKPPSMTEASSAVSASNSRLTSPKSRMADDTSDIKLLNDDSSEPDFGHLILLQGGVDAIQAALHARKEKRSAKRRGDGVTEKSQLTVKTDGEVDDAGYEVPAADDNNSPHDSDPTYEEVTFQYPQGKTRPAARWHRNPRSFFSTVASVFF